MRNFIIGMLLGGILGGIGAALVAEPTIIRECKTNSDIEGVNFSRECNGRLTISYQDGTTTLVCKEQ